jgi:hypothetical protein
VAKLMGILYTPSKMTAPHAGAGARRGCVLLFDGLQFLEEAGRSAGHAGASWPSCTQATACGAAAGAGR